MVRQTITTAQEVTDNSQAGAGFPQRLFDIESVEEDLVNTCLGEGLWAAMRADLTDVSGATVWNCNLTYALNAIVIEGGRYYKSTANDNTTKPCVAGSLWVEVPKFQSACYNNLWSYLVKIIASRVYSNAMPFSIFNSGNGGLTTNGPDANQVRSLTPSEIIILQKPINQIVTMQLANLKIWLNADAQKVCNFPANPFTGICETDCTTVYQRSRFFFR